MAPLNQSKTHSRKCNHFSYSAFKVGKSKCKEPCYTNTPLQQSRARSRSRCTGTFWQRAAPERCRWVVPGGCRPVGWPEPSAFARDTGCSCCTRKPYSDVPSSRCGFLHRNLYRFIRPLQIAQANVSIAPVLPENFWTCGKPREVAAVYMQVSCWVPLRPWTSRFPATWVPWRVDLQERAEE